MGEKLVERRTPLLRVCDLGSVLATRDVYLLTRSRDRKDASIRVIADEIVVMFDQARDLFL